MTGSKRGIARRRHVRRRACRDPGAIGRVVVHRAFLQRVVDNGHQGVAYPCFGAVDTRFIAEPFRRRRRAVVTANGHAAASVSNASGSHPAGAGRNGVDYPALASVVPV